MKTSRRGLFGLFAGAAAAPIAAKIADEMVVEPVKAAPVVANRFDCAMCDNIPNDPCDYCFEDVFHDHSAM